MAAPLLPVIPSIGTAIILAIFASINRAALYSFAIANNPLPPGISGQKWLDLAGSTIKLLPCLTKKAQRRQETPKPGQIASPFRQGS
ncbi:MAG: hypothetical protein WBH10_06800 [Allopontixanthobacter sediminis]